MAQPAGNQQEVKETSPIWLTQRKGKHISQLQPRKRPLPDCTGKLLPTLSGPWHQNRTALLRVTSSAGHSVLSSSLKATLATVTPTGKRAARLQ